jgi:hypothetical protein
MNKNKKKNSKSDKYPESIYFVEYYGPTMRKAKLRKPKPPKERYEEDCFRKPYTYDASTKEERENGTHWPYEFDADEVMEVIDTSEPLDYVFVFSEREEAVLFLERLERIAEATRRQCLNMPFMEEIQNKLKKIEDAEEL